MLSSEDEKALRLILKEVEERKQHRDSFPRRVTDALLFLIGLTLFLILLGKVQDFFLILLGKVQDFFFP